LVAIDEELSSHLRGTADTSLRVPICENAAVSRALPSD